MSEWDFAFGLTGQELEDALSSGATAEEWALIEAQDERKNQGDRRANKVQSPENQDIGKKKKKSR